MKKVKKKSRYPQTISKTPVTFQKDWPKTVGGVALTKYLLQTRNHAPRATKHRTTNENNAPPFSPKKARARARVCMCVFWGGGGGGGGGWRGSIMVRVFSNDLSGSNYTNR